MVEFYYLYNKFLKLRVVIALKDILLDIIKFNNNLLK
jgi:hypothetical protein